MKSIRIKMVVMYLVLVLIVMVAVGTFTVVRLRQNEEANGFDSLSDTADRIVDEIINTFYEHEFHENLFREFRSGEVFSITEHYILDANGFLLAASVTENIMSIDRAALNTRVLISALAGEAHFLAGPSFTNYQNFLVRGMQYARPVTRDGITYIIYIRMNAEEIYNAIDDILGTFLLGLLIAFALAAILGVFFAGTVNKPIKLLTNKAKEFASGQLDTDVEVFSDDEIGQLSESFNNMAHELKLTLVGLENEKNQKEIVLHNVTDGVLAYDTAGSLIHANHVCRELLGINVERIAYSQLLERLEIDADKIDDREPTEVVLSINDRYINVVINQYTGVSGRTEGVVLMLQDLTKHIHLDNMRKEFVANVSHELRTPLTTIKSYAETLLEEFIEAGEPQDSHNVDFLRTIEGEADRMTLLVNDLLELSRLDNKQLEFNFQLTDLTELIKNVVTRHRQTIEKAGSDNEILFDPPAKEMLILADTERINQVLNNIITNSLRYSGEESVVEIEVVEHGGYYIIRIMDNGVGIPPEDLERIFERFYRVDKARSRELGGTGLGLSISKDIIEAHGGTLTARSRLGMGTCMIITLEGAQGEEVQGEEISQPIERSEEK